MRIATMSTATLIGAGVIAAALTGCTQSGTSGSSSTASSSASSGGSATSAAATPSPSATPVLQAGIAGGTTAIALDPVFVSSVAALKIDLGVLNTAKLSSADVLTLPITGGRITIYDRASGIRPYVQGEIDHEDSGLSLKAGGQQIALRNLIIDPGNHSHVLGDVFLNGKSVVRDANLFRLDGTTLKPITKTAAGVYVLDGTTVYVSADAAALLNKTFGTTAVTDQLKVGTAKITIIPKQ